MPKITSALMTNPGRRSELHLNSKKRCAAGFAFAGGPLRDAADDVREYVSPVEIQALLARREICRGAGWPFTR